MSCPLESKDHELAYMIAHGYLADSMKANKPLDINAIISQVYESFDTEREYGLALIQSLPKHFATSLNYTDALRKFHKANGFTVLDIDELRDEFEDPENILKRLQPRITEEEVAEIRAENIQNIKTPKKPKKQSPDEIENSTKALEEKTDNFDARNPTSISSTGNNRKKNEFGNYVDIVDEKQDFYYNILPFFYNAFLNGIDPSKLEINGHTGFKLKLISKSKIDVRKHGRKDEIDFVDGKTGGTPTSNQEKYSKGIGLFLTDNDGNILYFDEDYNLKSENEGKPIYFNIRTIRFEGGKYNGSSRNLIPIKDLAKILQVTEEEAFRIQQEELKLLSDLRIYTSNTKDDIALEITGASRGFLNINFKGDTRIEDIDWVNSHIDLNIKTAKIDAPELGEVAGQMYVSIPGQRSIPIQADNLSLEDINKVLDLVYNNTLKDENGGLMTGKNKKTLAEHLLLTNPEGVQFFIRKDDTIKVTLKGKEITEENKQEIIDFLNTKYVNKKGILTPYNITDGQYAFSEPKGLFNEFTIQGDTVVVEQKDFQQHVIEKGSLRIIPNQQLNGKPVITFLNGYFNFAITPKEAKRVGIDIQPEVSNKEIENKSVQEINLTEQGSPEKKVEGIQRRKKRGSDIDTSDLHSVKLNPVKATPEEIAAAKKWFDNHPLSKFIKYEELFNVVNSNAWASFVDGGIKLYQGSNYTVLYHEAFHAFTQHFLSKEQKQNLYNEVSKTSAGKNALAEMAKKKKTTIDKLTTYDKYLAIEELLAEDFRQYVLSGGTKVLKESPERNSIFRKIYNFLKKLFNNISGKQFITDKTMLNVEELYSQLYIGNINNYTPSSKNAFFGNTALNSAKDFNLDLTQQDESLIIQSIDSIISTYIDNTNNKLGENNATFTSAVFTNPEKYLTNIYDTVFNELEDKRVDLLTKASKADSVEKEELLRKANLLDHVLDNFGTYELKDSLIGLHLSKSPYLQEHVKDLDREQYAKTQSDIEAARYDVQGSELSKTQMATDRLKFVLGSLKKYDENGKEELNSLGFPILMTLSETFKKLSLIIGENNEDPRTILTALEKAQKEHPWVKALISKMGPVSSPYSSTQSLWTGMWDIFYQSVQRLHSVLVNETTTDGEKTYEVLTGYAAAAFRQVERDFKSEFKVANNPNKYIIDSGTIGNKLDLKRVLEDFRGKLITPENKHAFLKAIGLPLSDNKQLIQDIETNNIGVVYIFDKLDKYSKNAQTRIKPITDIVKVLRDNINILEEVEGKVKLGALKSESSNLNKILSLEAKYNENYSNFSVLTVKGNMAYENSRMSTVAVNVKNINKVSNFNELIAIPEMSFLDPENNPRVMSLTILKSLFKYDKNTNTFGDKIKGSNLRFDLADGIQNIEEEAHADKDYSVATSNADSYSRLLQDVYSMFLEGKPSAITPGDKNTITIISVNKLLGTSEDGNLYIDASDFVNENQEGVNLGIQNAYNILLPQLDSELKEMAMIEEHQSNPTNLPNVLGYTVPDAKGTLRGNKFSAFSGIFDEKLENKLKELYAKEGTVKSLREDIINAFEKYFDKISNETENKIKDMLYVDDNLQEILQKNIDRDLSQKELNNLLIKAYTVNKWIHNLEHVTLFYGSTAQFKDLDKRGSAINSTGRMARVDEDMLSYINTQIGRPYSDKYSTNGYSKFSPILNTGVFNDEKIISEYVKSGEYEKAIKKELKARGLSEAKIKITVDRILKPYTEMETGDGQGWITFDSYRIMSIAENRWSDQQEALFQQIITDPKGININDIAEYFPVRKYQHFGPMAVTGLPVVAFHKFSLFPLIPGVIDGTKLEDLHHTMINNGIDYGTYNTGSKIGIIAAPEATKADNIFSENGEVNTNFKITNNPIHIKYIKDQLDINSEYKGKVIFSTQLRKLIEEGLVSNGVPINFKPKLSAEERKTKWDKLSETKKLENKLYNKYKNYESKIDKLIQFRTAELINEIGSTPEELELGKADITKLVNFVKKELKHQDLSNEELNFLGVNSKGQLINDLSLSPSAAQIEKLLNSIVNNRLIRQKVTGEALVQVSNNLFEPKNATKAQLEQYGTKDLRTYRKDPKTGKTLAMEVKVALQGNFIGLTKLKHTDGKSVGVYTERTKVLADGTQKVIRELNEEATLARLNEMITNEEWLSIPENVNMITMVGVRIPVQGLNSMEFMVVKQFLPARAGNIIVPPAEIVAKSGADFDVDKLTVMMPSITIINGKPSIVEETTSTTSHTQNIERVNEINLNISKLKEEKINLKDTLRTKYPTKYDLEIRDVREEMHTYKKIINKLILIPNLSEEQSEKLSEANNRYDLLYDLFNDLTEELDTKNEITKDLKKLDNTIADLTKEKASLSGKAIENSILFSIRDILELPENFLSLITPNDTSLVKWLADKLAGDREYIESDYASKYFEPAYNLYKHESNSVGKETLGLGAIDNTYNTIFNRIGAYLNPEYTKGEGNKATTHRAELLMNHNKMYGGISLSNMYDANNNLKISDIINQLMNGWVDVAKDAWIFDIQGNKQVSPVLLFMIQAGVPFEDAVYFASNPIVKEYVEEQKKTLSAFSKPLSFNSKDVSRYKSEAKVRILNKLGLQHLTKLSYYGSEEIPDNKAITKFTLNVTKNKNYSDLAESIYNTKTFDKAKRSHDALGAFFHYLELEEIAGNITDLKSKLNYDTSRSNSLFEAATAEANLDLIKDNDLFPSSVVEGILKESPIGSFRVAPLQLKLWNPLFPIRNEKVLNDYLISLLKDGSSIKKMKKMYGSSEKYIENFKNDLIVKIFSNTIRDFNISEPYKGLNTEVSTEIKQVTGLQRGVAVVPNKKGELTIYIDTKLLDKQLDTLLTESNDSANPESYKSLGLATVPAYAFESKKEYYKFSIEREYQRALNPFAKLSETHYFKFKYENNLIRFKDKITDVAQDERERRILQYTYEEILRNKALDNNLNLWKLFKSESTISDQLFEIKAMHKNLNSKYNIVRDLVSNSLEQSRKNKETQEYEIVDIIKNITLRDNRVPVEDMNVYQSNMDELSDSSIFSIPISEENHEQDVIENKRISEFFSNLPLVGFLQSGLNNKDNISLMKAMPTSKVVEVINESLDTYKNIMSSRKKSKNFLDGFKTEFNQQNSIRNIALRKRLKNYTDFSQYNLPNTDLTGIEVDSDFTLPLQFTNEFDLLKTKQLTATTRPIASGIKKGDIVEFKKDFAKHSESIKVIATSDEYPVSSISEAKWSDLENKGTADYNTAVETNAVQFTFESLREESEEVDLTTLRQPSTNVEPTIDLSREWSGDLKTRPVYTKEGVNTMRTTSAKPNEHFGNPFSESGVNGTIKVESIDKAVRAYKDWLLDDATTKDYGIDPKEFLKAIIISNGGKPTSIGMFAIDGQHYYIPNINIMQKPYGYDAFINVSNDEIYLGSSNNSYKDFVSEPYYPLSDLKFEQREWILNQINNGNLDGATLLYAGKLESRGQGMHPTALAEVVEELRSSKPQVLNNIKSGVPELFENNPELASIGTLEQYSQYLDTVFPQNTIVYRGSEKGRSQFKTRGFFTEEVSYAKEYAFDKGFLAKSGEGIVSTFLINTANVKNVGEMNTKSIENEPQDSVLKGVDKGRAVESGTVYATTSKNLHELGTKQDIEGFKGFVGKSTTQPSISVKNFNKKNLFTVTPQQGVSDNKAKAKASIATQYIGFGEGIVGKDGKRSTTQIYREQAGEYANTGNYSASDVIFVSIPGSRGDAQIARREQYKTIKETIKAVEAGATILTDNKAYTKASNYNTGEQILYANMVVKDYNYSEITVDGQLIGTWSKATQPSTSVKVVSEDYGVVQAETNPTKEQTEQFVNLLRPQIQKQTYKENKGKNANEMFHYGLMWARTNKSAKPVKINSFDKGVYYAYHELDQNQNKLPDLSVLQPIINEIQQSLGLDMSNYDSVIGNIYLDDQYVYPHKDTTESISARNYPVIVYTLGNDAGLGIVDNNEGKMTFANQYDKQWLPSQDKLKGYTNELKTKNGSIYTFGLDGKGRFELTHSTPINNKKMKSYPPITLPNGEITTKYTITLTFRRAADLEKGMPATPAKLTTQLEQRQQQEDAFNNEIINTQQGTNNLKVISNFTELAGASEYELKVPYDQLEEVRNRLTCKL